MENTFTKEQSKLWKKNKKKVTKVFCIKIVQEKVVFCFLFAPTDDKQRNLPKIVQNRQFFPEITTLQKTLLRRAKILQIF
jgi:hypothetical protein|tara:strand:- start:429 stop:668 length:240 start_codon:yes stop_codon:yes gene_type:complete